MLIAFVEIAINFCTLVLYLATLLNSVIHPNSLSDFIIIILYTFLHIFISLFFFFFPYNIIQDFQLNDNSYIGLTPCPPSPVKTLLKRLLMQRNRNTHRISANIFKVIHLSIVGAVTKTPASFNSKDLYLCTVFTINSRI